MCLEVANSKQGLQRGTFPQQRKREGVLDNASVVHCSQPGRPRVHVGAPAVVPRRSCSRNPMSVDQDKNRDLISSSNFWQNPNPGSVSRRAGAKFSICRLALVLLRVILQRCHSINSKSKGSLEGGERKRGKNGVQTMRTA
jgi:hypothetical protein